MAFNKHFVGNNVTVEIADAPANGGQATDFTLIEDIAAFPQMASAESTVVTVNVFGEKYVDKIIGSRSVPDLTISVNWKPGAVGQGLLDSALASDKLVQIKVTYYQNISDKDGAAYYSIVNGYVISGNNNGDFDAIVTRDYVVSITGGPVAVGQVSGS